VDRRELIQLIGGAIAGSPVATGSASTSKEGRGTVARSDRLHTPIRDWREDMIREQTDYCVVQGYPQRFCVTQGEAVELCVSSRSSRFSVTVIRDGASRERVLAMRNLAGRELPVPAEASTKGCGWPVTLSIPTADLAPGPYLVEFEAQGVDGPRALGHAFFVIRPRRPREGALLLPLSNNTYNAYNHWGGPSLYDGATQVAYDRPLLRGMLARPPAPFEGRISAPLPPGEGDPHNLRYYAHCIDNDYSVRVGLAGWYNQERRFFAWAERSGYTVDLCGNNDVDDDALLAAYKVVASVGHDEYWTMATRENLERWVRGGGRLATFSGNTCFWRVRLEDGVMVCHKYSAEATDPVASTPDRHLLTGMFAHRWVGRPENALLGVGSNAGLYARYAGATPRGIGGFVIQRPDHWMLTGTGLAFGDVLGARDAIASFEVNGCRLRLDEHGLAVPTGETGTPHDLEIVGLVPAILLSSDPRYSDYPDMTRPQPGAAGDAEAVAQALYGESTPAIVDRVRRGHGVLGSMALGRGEVFAGSTTHWAYGLGSDPIVERVTRNVLDRFLA
jgi:hypothetical protein